MGHFKSEKDHMLKQWESEKEEASRERANLAKEREDLRSQLAQAQRSLAEAAAGAAQRQENHLRDVKRFQEENAGLRLRLEQTFAAILSESRQLEGVQRAREEALKAETCQLAEEWQAKLKSPNILTDSSHPQGHPSLCVVGSIDCSTADASVVDSSDAEQFESLPAS